MACDGRLLPKTRADLDARTKARPDDCTGKACSSGRTMRFSCQWLQPSLAGRLYGAGLGAGTAPAARCLTRPERRGQWRKTRKHGSRQASAKGRAGKSHSGLNFPLRLRTRERLHPIPYSWNRAMVPVVHANACKHARLHRGGALAPEPRLRL